MKNLFISMKNNILYTIFLLVLCPFTVLSSTIIHKGLDFTISDTILNSTDIHYSFSTYENEDFLRTSLSQIDVEEFSKQRNAKILFSKSAFTINTPIHKINTSLFSNTKVIKKLMGASKLTRVDPSANIWQSEIPIIIYTVESKLEVRELNSTSLTRDVFMDYYLAADDLDQEIGLSDFQVHIRLTDFSLAFDGLVIITKFIPSGNKTTVISYFIAKSDKYWWMIRNPFGAATNKVKGIILNVLTNTKTLLEK